MFGPRMFGRYKDMDRKTWGNSFQLRGKIHGGEGSTYIIAEIGTNHGGELTHAKELVYACAEAGANAVKFQSWSARQLQNVKDLSPDGTLHESKVISILEKYEIPEDWYAKLIECCQGQGVDFLSTPFDIERARLLRSLKVPAIKIASGDLTYEELLKEVGNYNIPILLSTGMANLGEVERAMEHLGQRKQRDIILLHCVAAYPPKIGDANLLAIRTLKEAFGLPIGISDHTSGHNIALAAVALGACVIEKHVTFSRTDGHPDSFFSLEIDEFRAMVEAVRSLESALGDGKKRCMPSEADGRIGGRRCLFASRDITPGQVLKREDIAVVRPNIGELKPKHLNLVLGRRVKIAVSCGAPLQWEYLET